MTGLLRLFRLSRYGLAGLALVLSVAADGKAQSNDWLLGAWSGTWKQADRSGPIAFTFREESGMLKWTMTIPVRGGTAEAEGVVTKFDASSAELEGKFTAHTLNGWLGSGYKVHVTGTTNALSGWAIAERTKSPTTVELTKGK